MRVRTIGVVLSPHGVRGLVKVKSEADDFKTLLEDHPVSISGTRYRAVLSGAKTSPFIVRLEGVDDRNAATALKGQALTIAWDRPATTEASASFIVDEILGCTVEEDGADVGTITHMFNFGAGEIVEITYPNGESELFAFNTPTFPRIDTEARRVVINRPTVL